MPKIEVPPCRRKKNGRVWITSIKDKNLKRKGNNKWGPKEDTKIFLRVCGVKTNNHTTLAGDRMRD